MSYCILEHFFFLDLLYFPPVTIPSPMLVAFSHSSSLIWPKWQPISFSLSCAGSSLVSFCFSGFLLGFSGASKVWLLIALRSQASFGPFESWVQVCFFSCTQRVLLSLPMVLMGPILTRCQQTPPLTKPLSVPSWHLVTHSLSLLFLHNVCDSFACFLGWKLEEILDVSFSYYTNPSFLWSGHFFEMPIRVVFLFPIPHEHDSASWSLSLLLWSAFP